MNVTKQEFEARNIAVDYAIETLRAEVKSSYASIMDFMLRLESHMDERFNALEEKFNTLSDKVDRMDQRLTRLADDVVHMNSNFGSRFDVISGQQRLNDQGQFRTEQRFSTLERRVDMLEEKAG